MGSNLRTVGNGTFRASRENAPSPSPSEESSPPLVDVPRQRGRTASARLQHSSNNSHAHASARSADEEARAIAQFVRNIPPEQRRQAIYMNPQSDVLPPPLAPSPNFCDNISGASLSLLPSASSGQVHTHSAHATHLAAHGVNLFGQLVSHFSPDSSPSVSVTSHATTSPPAGFNRFGEPISYFSDDSSHSSGSNASAEYSILNGYLSGQQSETPFAQVTYPTVPGIAARPSLKPLAPSVWSQGSNSALAQSSAIASTLPRSDSTTAGLQTAYVVEAGKPSSPIFMTLSQSPQNNLVEGLSALGLDVEEEQAALELRPRILPPLQTSVPPPPAPVLGPPRTFVHHLEVWMPRAQSPQTGQFDDAEELPPLLLPTSTQHLRQIFAPPSGLNSLPLSGTMGPAQESLFAISDGSTDLNTPLNSSRSPSINSISDQFTEMTSTPESQWDAGQIFMVSSRQR